ncbi:MAG: hypothetical protein EP315_05015 [Gammaproteobacteria bacterium]|nr:MAG: hypothetical protein EP315_05015 [Gammaproteobacteria bacterium]
MKFSLITAILSLGILHTTHADQRTELEGISIIGNKEMPNILYIVPWKTPEIPNMIDIPLTTLINQSLEPIDRQTVIREEQYYNALKSVNTSAQTE